MYSLFFPDSTQAYSGEYDFQIPSEAVQDNVTMSVANFAGNSRMKSRLFFFLYKALTLIFIIFRFYRSPSGECHSQRRPLTDMNGRVFEIPTISACCSVEKKNFATEEVNEGLLHYKNFGNINKNIIFISLMRFLIIQISIFKSTQVSTFARAIKPKTAGVICKT